MASRPLVRSLATAVFAVGLSALAGCGSDDHGAAGSDGPSDHAEAAEFAWGTPAEASTADRDVDIDANDDFTFEPEQVTVVVGETVTFRVTNTGELPHDFTLGDEATQDEHEEEMQEMPEGDSHGEVNAMTIAAGETQEMTWTFDRAGTIIMGCHIPGHYAAGMRGEIVAADR